ncbi:hypothetical protein [Natronobiforma cellulositropha]|uniref:hypothetical protein n=1 Tax=Natronobiforma cellulositropha TaxID=1679076 RepID=UPI0021D5F6B8|nr:hypothetical protein [Natronobiforma cellulositropha]
MLEHLSATCDRCDRALCDDRLILSMTTDAGTRRAYECRCGGVTVTVVRDASSDGASSRSSSPPR